MVARHQQELGIQMVPFQEMIYVQERAEYAPGKQVSRVETEHNISGTEFRRRLQEGLGIPDWFTYPEVVPNCAGSIRRAAQGFTLFFTGFRGPENPRSPMHLWPNWSRLGGRPVSLLDGDIVRQHLSSELGFSKEHRDLNILRIGFVASEITKNGGIAICAPIAPYAATRRDVREMIERAGGFLEMYVATRWKSAKRGTVKACTPRRAGLIKEFTGISDPYEAPENPEMVIDTPDCTPDEAAQRIILKLEKLGYIK